MIELLKANAQSLFALGGVLLGSLITFWINKSNLKQQSIERDKDRQEQKREAKTQLSLELKRSDIRIIEQSIDNHLKAMEEMRRMNLRHLNSGDEKGEEQSEFTSKLIEEDGLYELVHISLVADKLAYSLGDEVYSEYKNFINLYGGYLVEFLRPSTEKEGISEMEFQANLIRIAGKLHLLLEEKLISIRDT